MANKFDKATVPQLLHKLLPREQIAKIVDTASLFEAIYMVGPYGCGKTLAALSWLHGRGRRAAWISLDENDDTETAFAGLLESALSPFAVKRGDADVLPHNQGGESMQPFLTDTASRILEGSIAIDTLVIDNFHHIKDAARLRDIKNFVHSLLGHVRVIILSRAELPSIFNDLVLKKHICLITTKELSFSLEESADYFKLNMLPVSRQSLSRIHDDTEGWPAAINVILMTSRDGPVSYGEYARTYVNGFFETEIWSGLDQGVRDFLLKTSVLDKLTPPACHALTGIGATLPILGWLFTNGLFITRLEKDTYKYHRVFKDYLLDKLESSDIDKKSLYKQYAWWLFERYEFEQSFPYFFKARDLYGINQLLKVLNPAAMSSIERFLEIVGCLTTLDTSDLMPYPVIIARIALIEYLMGNVARFGELYRTLAEWLDPGQLPISAEEYAEYRWEIGWLSYLHPGMDSNDPKHLEHSNYRYYLPRIKEWHVARFAVLSFPSYFRGIRDYGNDYIFTFDRFLARVENGEKYLIDEEEVLWNTYLISAEYEYELENFTKAEEIVRRVMPLVEDRHYAYLYFICTALLVKLARATGHSGEIDALTARLETIIMNTGQYFLLPNFHAFEMRNRLASGEAGFTESFMDENRGRTDDPGIYLLYRHITFVRGLLTTGGYSEAIILLGNLDLMACKYSRPTDLIEVNILRSIAFYKLGQEEAARGYLVEALQASKKYGYIRMFSDDAAALWPILNLLGKSMSGAYMQKVLLSCKKELVRSGQKPSGKSPKHTVLTKTEIKILRCLQLGMSYKDIEIDNGIQASTVKSHVHSIYSKLDVNNRTAAVIAAQKRGILA